MVFMRYFLLFSGGILMVCRYDLCDCGESVWSGRGGGACGGKCVDGWGCRGKHAEEVRKVRGAILATVFVRECFLRGLHQRLLCVKEDRHMRTA